MKIRGRQLVVVVLIFLTAPTTLYLLADSGVGEVLDEYRGVEVRSNGLTIVKSHGRHFAEDGYYYGQKWQCVEYVKRFFHQVHRHRMPDVWGHARDFWDDGVSQGALNKRRGLVQFRNGGTVPPREGDLVVFTGGGYGHVAIVSEVRSNAVEVIQQNIPGRTRDLHPLRRASGTNWMGGEYAPAGWLRVPGARPAADSP